MAFVLDASITACWAFQDEQHADADLAFVKIRTEEAVVPSLWWFEVRNILVVNERRGRINLPDSSAFLLYLAKLSVRIDRMPEEASVLRMAREFRLSVYDAAYLELAHREGVAIATLDTDLRKAARRQGVPLHLLDVTGISDLRNEVTGEQRSPGQAEACPTKSRKAFSRVTSP